MKASRALRPSGCRSRPGGWSISPGLADAVAALPGPLALKAVSDALPHKTEVGGVALGLAGPEAVLAAAETMRAKVAESKPGLEVDRFLLEPMVDGAVAEVIVGVWRDPLFGLVLVIGAGGILVELLPVSPPEIEAAIRRLKTFPLLDGFRGRPKGDLPALVAAIQAIAHYAEAERLVELDVNPLMILPMGQGAVAVDALIVEAG